jgi:hypothetical protein
MVANWVGYAENLDAVCLCGSASQGVIVCDYMNFYFAFSELRR